MDLLILDETYQPTRLIENYDSLIWTERFNTVGDFQIITGRVDQFMDLMPEGTVLSLFDSNIPMIVETHLIERKKGERTLLTIKGRAFESVLDRRASIDSLTSGLEWVVLVKTPSDAAHYIMYEVCVAGVADPDDIFPAFVQFDTPDDYLASTGPTRSFTIPRGQLLPAVLGLLNISALPDPTTTPATPEVVPHGLRVVRPAPGFSAVTFQMYTGTDRSETVYFDGTRDLLDDGAYLFSKVGSATTAYAAGDGDGIIVNMDSAGPVTGLERRVLFVEGKDSGSDADALTELGRSGLGNATPTALFDGSINQDISPYVFGQDYFLGDIVKLVGDYGLQERARVTEYIRTEDATGSHAYPTFASVQEGVE